MPVRRILPWLLGTLALLTVVIRPPAPATDPAPAPRPDPGASFRPSPALAPPAAAGDDPRAAMLERFAYARGWDSPPAGPLAAFRAWTGRYLAAPPGDRTTFEAEGVALARARRDELHQLIRTRPDTALAAAVPMPVRAELPPAVVAQLERRVAGTGDFGLQAMSYEGPRPAGAPTRRLAAFVAGETFDVFTYGRRTGQPAREGASLHGIAIDRDLALHESPLRVLDPGEVPAVAPEPRCPGCGAPTSVPRVVNDVEVEVVEAFGRVWRIDAAEGGPEALARRLEADEDRAAPRVAPLVAGEASAAPPVAADAATAWTIGTKRVLVIRVDFPDFPGTPVAESDIGSTLNVNVRSFFEEGSQGLCSLQATVSAKVYRLPQNGAAYATANNTGGLHSDARAAAAADFTLAEYDRIMVAFTGIGTSRVPGSKFTWAGLASVNGTSSWINGAFSIRTITHELGHNHGLKHASLWRVTDGNPLSPVGSSREYGEPFDMMGDAFDRDQRHHFNVWAKNLLGWLPDSAVTTVAESGVYRIYRFDSPAAAAGQPLALRIFRDGVRWYWVSHRQAFGEFSPLARGVSVLWGFNALQESQLIDCTTPGDTPLDSALPLGTTLDDRVAGVRIRPVAQGGGEPRQWIDVEVTLPAAPPGVVAAWGGGQNFLDTPTAVTYVPLDLREVTALAAGRSHVLALRGDGTVRAWGDNGAGQAVVPDLGGRAVALAAGGNLSGIVRADGTVRVWGDTGAGPLVTPEGLAGVRQLALGTNHAVALLADGTVTGWGSNAAGQLAFPPGLSGITAVAAGIQTTLLLRRDGTVLALGPATFRAVPAGLAGVVAIAAGGTHGLAVRADGTVAAWGNNGNGQATVPAGLGQVTAVAAGDFHSMALRADGSIAAWGSNTSGKVTLPGGLPRAAALAASSQASFALISPRVHIIEQPVAQTVPEGGEARLSVAAAGPGPLSYQWRRDGVVVPGATAATLALAGLTAAQAGTYDVIVSDGTSSLATFPVRLVVAAAVPEVGRIANLSLLTPLPADGSAVTMGFVVGGTGTAGSKRLLVRAAGPSLAALGVPGSHPDPRLELFAGSSRVGQNNDWGGTSALVDAALSVGAFPLAGRDSRDAALVADLSSRNNSVRVTGTAGSGGLMLAEVYDLTPPRLFGASVPRLINVSVLQQLGPGLTAGFVIAGPVSRRVLVRAVGPTLAQAPFNVPGVAADPSMVLFGEGQVRLGENDNWGGTAELAAASSAVGAFTLGPASRDAALLATLVPGAYSVAVSSAGGVSGLVLLEVYEVP